MSIPKAPRLSTLPVEQAKDAIALLEKRIADDFGYYVSLGAELEFVVRAREGVQGEPLGIRALEPHEQSDHTPQGWRPETQRNDALFPDSPYICYSYREDKTLPPLYKYETVISHRAIDKEDKDDHVGRGALLSRVVDSITAAILGDYRNGVAPANAPQGLRDKVSEIHVTPYVYDVLSHSDAGITNGLHINASIHRYGAPITMQQQGVVERAIRKMCKDTIYLLGTDEKSMMRYKTRNSEKDIVSKFDYIENALPGAASNPYYATLTTLAGIYAGLAELKGSSLFTTASAHEAIGEHKLHPIALRAKEVFQHPQNQLHAVLNHLEPGRGDQFFDTIDAHPPGTEMRRVSQHSTHVEQAL